MNVYSENRVYRILDANANRATEGLRTIEEYFRFIVEDTPVSSSLKQLRHDLMISIGKFDRIELLKHRNVMGDIGCSIKTDSEKIRDGISAILMAASQRIQQSLRCLEEYSKLINPTIASEFEQLRYRAYALLADIELRIAPQNDRLIQARLYVLVDCQLPIAAFVARCLAISEAGADVLQIRDKQCDTRTLMNYTRQLADCLDVNRTHLIVNDRVDLAATLGLGVHLGQEDLPIAAARSILSGSQVVGLSTHTIGQAIEAQRCGADYIGCGPTFPSKTKDFMLYSGLEFLRQVATETSISSFAIGGITLERLDEVLATGIRRVAVSHAIWQAPNPADMTHAFANRLSEFVEVAN